MAISHQKFAAQEWGAFDGAGDTLFQRCAAILIPSNAACRLSQGYGTVLSNTEDGAS